MGLDLVSFSRWNQLTCPCFAHICLGSCHRLQVLHLQPYGAAEQSTEEIAPCRISVLQVETPTSTLVKMSWAV